MLTPNHNQLEYLNLAYKEAKKAHFAGRPAIGAIIVKNGLVIAKAHNQKDHLKDATSHAEVLVIRKAGKKIGPNLDNSILYVTLKPCLMCLMACYWAHIRKVVYGLEKSKNLKKYFETNIDLSGQIIKDLLLRKLEVVKVPWEK